MSDGGAREPIKSIVTPSRLEYAYTAAGSHAQFLANIAEGRLVGKRCSSCEKVYVPPRSACPRCGVALAPDLIEIPGHGTVTTFCIVRVPSSNIELKLPYVAAHILLDGSDMPFFSLLQEVEAADVRMGMRVEAVWAPREEWGPTFENIRYFRPTGEPDIPYDDFKEHL